MKYTFNKPYHHPPGDYTDLNSEYEQQQTLTTQVKLVTKSTSRTEKWTTFPALGGNFKEAALGHLFSLSLRR